MNPGGGACSEPRSGHWATEQDSISKNKKKKRNEIMAFSATWMELEITSLNEVTPEWKTKHCMFSLIIGS